MQLATGSRYSHCGIIYENEGEYFVYEASSKVKLTKLNEWIDWGEDGHYVVKRLNDHNVLLNNNAIIKMIDCGKRFNEKKYDIYFEWSDEKIYCSELVYKIYKNAIEVEVGKLEKIKDFDLTSPIVKQKMAERYGNNIPLNETVISPKSIFDSDLLFTVYAN